MGVLIVLESLENKLGKSAFELASYGKKTAQLLNTSCYAIVIGNADNAGELGVYGADKVYSIVNSNMSSFDSQSHAAAVFNAATKLNCDVVILRHNSNGKSIAGRLAIKMKAGSVSGVNALPDVTSEFMLKKTVYSGKAIAEYAIKTSKKVFTLMGNAIQPESMGSIVSVEPLEIEVPAPKIKVTGVNKTAGTVPLPEAELVVSAGRGMKGPENWGIIEELAKELDATTACSRPVADTGWRPHHEHVGQTGVAIRPNLYIAIGISGAIQHLAGVNNSKTIVVINKDAEAPFFKAADYGVVGDLFDAVPKLTAAIKKYKGR